MNVVTTHHIDAGEKDAQGFYDFYHEYDLYCFDEGGESVVARSYSDTANEAHFLRWEFRGASRLLRDADLKTPLFIAAAAYLRAAGKIKLTWLSGRGNGYEPVSNA